MVAASSGSALNSSAFRLSWPGAFPFLRELMAWIISLLVGTSVLMSRSVVASWMFGTTVGGGLFKSSLKCSVQRRCCSPSDVNKIPFLSFTSTLVVWHLPVMTLVTLYTVPCSLRAAASSAWKEDLLNLCLDRNCLSDHLHYHWSERNIESGSSYFAFLSAWPL